MVFTEVRKQLLRKENITKEFCTRILQVEPLYFWWILWKITQYPLRGLNKK
jgi:hypothetical protein